MRVLGIDPGLRVTGYAVVRSGAGPGDHSGQIGACVGQDQQLIEAGVIRVASNQSLESRLGQLYDDLLESIEESAADHLAVEKLYAHYNHPRTAILMGHARGVILLAAQQHGLPVVHLPATEIKKAITGYGRASKQQIQLAVQSHFGLPEPPSPPDVADAIAIAMTGIRRLATANPLNPGARAAAPQEL